MDIHFEIQRESFQMSLLDTALALASDPFQRAGRFRATMQHRLRYRLWLGRCPLPLLRSLSLRLHLLPECSECGVVPALHAHLLSALQYREIGGFGGGRQIRPYFDPAQGVEVAREPEPRRTIGSSPDEWRALPQSCFFKT